MVSLVGFEDVSLLSSGRHFEVFRARRSADGALVALKRVAGADPEGEFAAQLRHERALTAELPGAHVARANELIDAEGGAVLVREFQGARTLAARIAAEPMSVAEVCRVGSAVCKALSATHRAGVVHRDVKPSNLLLDLDGSHAWITDFGIAARMVGGRCPTSRERIEGSFAYMAPEQTGRTQRAVVPATDLYALGVVLYEMLTGRTPFKAHTPLEWIHAHLAAAPPDVRALRPDAPAALAAIVAKLLQKDPDARYQSAEGLADDLDRCARALSRGEPLEGFTPGASDIASRFQRPEGVVGRETLVASLHAAFERARAGGFALLRLTGESGAGKSSLVRALRGEVAARDALFVEGKHDVLRRAVPYAALLSALRRALRMARSSDAAERQAWQARVREATQPNAAALAEVIPELAALLGPMGPLPAVGPAESDVRFQLALRGLLEALATPERPAVLFLDDLQWADESTLTALAGLAARAPASTLVVTAERGGEDDPGGARAALWSALGERVTALEVGPLDEAGVRALVARVFPSDAAQVAALAEVVRTRTRGNPFAAVEFLGALADAGLARFDPEARRWDCDPAAAADAKVPDTAAGLVAARLDALDAEGRADLAVAAALGDRFDPELLAQVSGSSGDVLARRLEHAAGEGLVIPVALDGGLAWRFAHDRVEEAAYASLPEDARPTTHARIYRALRARWGDALDGPRRFALAHHLARSVPALRPEERGDARRIARSAGAVARSVGAWRAAQTHLDLAVALGPGERAEALALHVDRAECAYLATDFDAMDRAAAEALSLASSPVERAAVEDVRVRAANHRGDHARAVDVALRALAELGHAFPDAPGNGQVMSALAATKLRLAFRPPESLDALPALTDPTQLAALRLMIAASGSAFFVAPALFPLLVFRVLAVTVQHGASAHAPFGYAGYGLLLAAHFGQVDAGYRFGLLARRTVDRFGADALRGQVEFLFNFFVRHWREPLSACAADMAAASRQALEVGGLEYWSYNLTGASVTELLRGASLDALAPRIDRERAQLQELKQHKTAILAAAMRLTAGALRGDHDLDALSAAEAEGLQGYRASGDVNGVANLCLLRAVRGAILGDTQAALEAAREAESHAAVLAGQIYLPALRFFHALALADALAAMPAAQRVRAHVKLRQILAAYRGWGAASPQSYAGRALLLEAEVARAEGRDLEAGARYDDALADLAARGTDGDAALAYARAAAFQRARGRASLATSYAREAVDRAERWGARALSRALRARFELRDEASKSLRPAATTTSTQAVSVDFESSLKAARAISEEIELERLQTRLVEVVIENAGARRGVLIALRDKDLRVVAEGTVASGAALCDRALDAADDLPRPLVRLVAQTGETVLLDDAAASADFGADPYLRRAGARSVLCVALARQGAVNGVLYLEHDGAAGVFTPQRAEVLRVLAAQAAVSLENATLYADLARSLRRQVSLTQAQARFVPTEFLSSLGRGSIDEVALGDSVQREMTVLFSDMRSFTRHVEGMSPVENISFINEYLSAMEPTILAQGGFVDSYIGDAIMALFDVAPERAVAAAVNMHRALAPLNAAREARGAKPLRIGVGLNTGELTLGTIGGPQRIKCGVIGDCVNLAARIESLTKRYGAGVLIGDRTLSQLPEGAFTTREVDRVRVVGRLAPVTLIEVLDADPEPLRAAKLRCGSDWAEALARYRDGELTAARDAFRRCLDAAPDDGAAALRLQRCEAHLAAPPQGPWTGVEELVEK
ncbi:MAG: AAA family ATPase [Polyangiales bacterium]